MKFNIGFVFVFLTLSCSDTNHDENMDKSNMDENAIIRIKKGKELAMKAGNELMANLTLAIAEKGTVNALEFCATKAIDLTDSISNELGSYLRRVSDKNRNLNNAANAQELSYILKAKKTLNSGGDVKPQLTQVGTKSIGYYPIITNSLCMQCHGDPSTEIREETLLKIDSLYPDDKARGYDVNELRGIWVVEMSN